MITDQQLNDIQSYCDAASDAPWHHVSQKHRGRDDSCYSFGPHVDNIGQAVNDAAFISNARDDLPACVAEIRRLNIELRVLRGELKSEREMNVELAVKVDNFECGI